MIDRSQKFHIQRIYEEKKERKKEKQKKHEALFLLKKYKPLIVDHEFALEAELGLITRLFAVHLPTSTSIHPTQKRAKFNTKDRQINRNECTKITRDYGKESLGGEADEKGKRHQD